MTAHALPPVSPEFRAAADALRAAVRAYHAAIDLESALRTAVERGSFGAVTRAYASAQAESRRLRADLEKAHSAFDSATVR